MKPKRILIQKILNKTIKQDLPDIFKEKIIYNIKIYIHFLI